MESQCQVNRGDQLRHCQSFVFSALMYGKGLQLLERFSVKIVAARPSFVENILQDAGKFFAMFDPTDRVVSNSL